MKRLYTVGELRKHFEDVRDDVMLVDGELGNSWVVVAEADIYIDVDTGEESLGIPIGGVDLDDYEDEDEGSSPTLKLVT